METRRIVAVVILIIMGLLQLWDSRVFSAGPAAISIALAGLALPIATLVLTERMDLRMAAVVACAVLLLTAKAFAPHPLPAIGVTAAIALAANWLAAMPKRPA